VIARQLGRTIDAEINALRPGNPAQQAAQWQQKSLPSIQSFNQRIHAGYSILGS
jgi:hypothetical protein